MIGSFDTIGLSLAAVLGIAAVAVLGWRQRRKANRAESSKVRQQLRKQNVQELHAWLFEKMTADLAKADSETVPYIKAFIELTHQSGTVDELRPIVEVYRYRKGFKSEWIGE
jgi:uncharacterized protein HemX